MLKITPKKPEVGQKVTVTYTGKLAAKEGTKLSFVSYFARNNYIPQKGIETKRVGNSLVGSFILPDNVSYIMMVISNKKEFDRTTARDTVLIFIKTANRQKELFSLKEMLFL